MNAFHKLAIVFEVAAIVSGLAMPASAGPHLNIPTWVHDGDTVYVERLHQVYVDGGVTYAGKSTNVHLVGDGIVYYQDDAQIYVDNPASKAKVYFCRGPHWTHCVRTR